MAILIQIVLPSFLSSDTGARPKETVSVFQEVPISLYFLWNFLSKTHLIISVAHEDPPPVPQLFTQLKFAL